MKKFVLIVSVFGAFFLYLYLQQKILILAYEINGRKMMLEQLREEKADIMCLFLRETNLASLNQRIADDGMHFQYPREYVRLVPGGTLADTEDSRPTVLARVLGLASQAEAQPVEANE